MNLAPFNTFLVAAVGASSAFIGFLLVALSLVLARVDAGANLKFTDRRLAESSYAALSNIFFVSFIGLLPDNDIGHTAVIVALFGLVSLWRLVARFKEVKRREAASGYISDVSWIVIQFLIYVAEGVYGIRIVMDPANSTNLYVLMSILLALFAMSLVRIWQLTGIRGE